MPTDCWTSMAHPRLLMRTVAMALSVIFTVSAPSSAIWLAALSIFIGLMPLGGISSTLMANLPAARVLARLVGSTLLTFSMVFSRAVVFSAVSECGGANISATDCTVMWCG